ncbi:MAG TPA: (d)CMP kinase [Acidimicrobiales bacterium]|nr:(d)CMP kinase [Acidimicrobiales bacterium]
MTTIAIDGPSGSGKSTLARLLGAHLGLECLDTGAMYRSVALLAIESGTDPTDVPALVALAVAMDLEVGERVILNGVDVTGAIRSPEVTAAVSTVASQQPVRDELVRRQRLWVAARRGGVVEGRDIGTVVLPDADVKVFLTAKVEERARRRAEEPEEAGGGGPIETYLESMSARDAKDASREVSPLQVAPDALSIDSTATTPEVVAELVLAALEKRSGVRDVADDVPGSPVLRSSERVPDRVRSDVRAVRAPGKSELAFYALCRAFVVGVSKVAFPGRVLGAERLPRSGAYILTPIHRSYVDWLVAARVTRRRLRFVVKAEIWKVRSVGRLIELLGAFPVHRGSADRESLARCLEVLAVGEPLVVFPEGTRQHGLEVQELLEGAAYMALRANVPIYPLGLAGTEESMPRGKKLPRPSRVRLVVGEPLMPTRSDGGRRVSRRETSALTEALRAAIQLATDEAREVLVADTHRALKPRYRRNATPAQMSSATPKGHVPDQKP